MRLLALIVAAVCLVLFAGLALAAIWFIDRDKAAPLSAEDTTTIEIFREMNRPSSGRHHRVVPANAPPAAVLPDFLPDEPEWAHLARNWTDQTGSFKALVELGKE